MPGIEPATAYLLTQGVLGVFAVIAGLVIWTLWKALQDCQSGRLVDAQKLGPIIEANTNTIEDIVQAMAERTRANDQHAAALSALTREVQQLTKEIERRP